MRAVGVKALKNRLSEYVRAAAAGETVLVTDRDRVVAELGPPRAGRAEVRSDAAARRGRARGMDRGSSGRRRGAAATAPPVAAWKDLSRELDEDRGEP